MGAPGVRFQFEDCLLDNDRRELVRGSTPVAVGPQVFDLLVHLLQNREHVVSKDALFDTVWQGRIVSESTLTSHINAARRAIGDTGREQRLIRTIARKGFRFVGDVIAPDPDAALLEPGPAAAAEPRGDPMPPDDRPSICVLPFLNLSGDPAEDYFVDGVVEDIITAFSRNRWLFVIARNSSFAYKGRSIDVRQAGRELGVRYVLEGSVRKAANRVRITGQLIDAATGRQLWAERFEEALYDIFALQDQVAESVSGAIAPQLERAEIERAKRTPTESMHAYDYYLRGIANQHRGDRESTAEALALFNKAVELDPNFASAHAMAAWCLFWFKVNGWLTDPAEIDEGIRLARRALDLGRDDAVAMTRAGHVLGHLGKDLHSGIAWLDRALVLNPNLAAAWFLGGFLRTWVGEPDSAIRHFERAMRLSPLDPELYRMQGGMAAAHLFAGRHDEATEWAEKSFRDLPSFLLSTGVIAAGHALAGRMERARPAVEHLRGLDPSLRISTLGDWLPIHRQQDLAVLAEGLRLAGLPE